MAIKRSLTSASIDGKWDPTQSTLFKGSQTYFVQSEVVHSDGKRITCRTWNNWVTELRVWHWTSPLRK